MPHLIDHLEARRREIVASLRERMIASGIPRTRLAIAAGLSEMTLRKFDEPGWSPKDETIRKLDTFLSGRAESRTPIRNKGSDCKPSPTDGAEDPAREAAA
jgi:hypothetical protein